MVISAYTHHKTTLPGRISHRCHRVPPGACGSKILTSPSNTVFASHTRKTAAGRFCPCCLQCHAYPRNRPRHGTAFPDSWYIPSKPMVRYATHNRYSKIKVVGLCYQIYAGYGMAGYLLAKELGIDIRGPISTHADPKFCTCWERFLPGRTKIDIKAAGLNHDLMSTSVTEPSAPTSTRPSMPPCSASPISSPLTKRAPMFGLFGPATLLRRVPARAPTRRQSPGRSTSFACMIGSAPNRAAMKATSASVKWAKASSASSR